ncbi:MAG: MFS transporter [Rhizobiales bacterium]|nr:MFS transporter [Hyphomicrobiales bacterium]
MWGVAYGGVSVALQIWMMKASPNAIEVVTSLFVATFNIGIALGLFAGGRVVDHFGLHSNILLAASLPAIGLFFLRAIRSCFLRSVGMTKEASE